MPTARRRSQPVRASARDEYCCAVRPHFDKCPLQDARRRASDDDPTWRSSGRKPERAGHPCTCTRRHVEPVGNGGRDSWRAREMEHARASGGGPFRSHLRLQAPIRSSEGRFPVRGSSSRGSVLRPSRKKSVFLPTIIGCTQRFSSSSSPASSSAWPTGPWPYRMMSLPSAFLSSRIADATSVRDEHPTDRREAGSVANHGRSGHLPVTGVVQR
jgi:hypothetical protein